MTVGALVIIECRAARVVLAGLAQAAPFRRSALLAVGRDRFPLGFFRAVATGISTPFRRLFGQWKST